MTTQTTVTDKRLRDYEAVVDALERLLGEVEFTRNSGQPYYIYSSITPEPWIAARAALRCLRNER